jgi:hypothetical protein
MTRRTRSLRRLPEIAPPVYNGGMNSEPPNVRTADVGDLDVLVAGNLALAEETERVHLDT